MTIQEIEDACENYRPIPPADVVRARMEFPFTRTFYPLGFPVEMSTNSEAVLDIATKGWGAFTAVFTSPPIRIQIGVLDVGSDECPPATTCLVQKHIFSFVADQNNFGIIDMARAFCAIWLTPAAVANPAYLRQFFLECAIACPIATRYTTGVHAGCVSRNGVGVLLCGDSGAGKSTLSYACAKAGWTYTTDDASYMVHEPGDLQVVGNCHQIRFRPATSEFFPELEGREITRRAEAGKPSIELRSESLPGITYAQSAYVKHLVILNRREGINAPLRPYSKEVVRKFLHQGRFSPLDMMRPHYTAIEKLLQLDVVEMRYTDLDYAIEQLESLVATGRP
jgi:hypothetical protein